MFEVNGIPECGNPEEASQRRQGRLLLGDVKICLASADGERYAFREGGRTDDLY